ncbi:MAG TPA: hypothetical protein VF824_06255 [Thermoanaerobaculia bacterium]
MVLLAVPTLTADHLRADCPLSLADATAAESDFESSPHGVFRSGSTVFVLRGGMLTTYTANDLGNLVIAREDFVGSLHAREAEGGVAFAGNFLYVSSEAGLEVFRLSATAAPVPIARIPGVHYRRLTVSGNRLAGLFPMTDMGCAPRAGFPACSNQIDIYDISAVPLNPAGAPTRVGSILSTANPSYLGFNDIAFVSGYLIAVSNGGLFAFDIANPAAPVRFAQANLPGKWLVTNGTNVVGVGNDVTIDMVAVRPGMLNFFLRTQLLTAPLYLTIDRSNEIRFSRNAFFDDTTGRLVTMIDEIDPQTLESARTIAFDVYDLTVPQLEGSAERIYEEVTMTTEDEVKHNPVAVGPYVYVIGESSGLQTWGSCGAMTGRIELDSVRELVCGSTQVHGWVTGTNKVISVELFLDTTSLGPAKLGESSPRNNISATTPITPWTIGVNFDTLTAGTRVLRAIGTDINNNRRQFAAKPIYFPGPGQNCITPKRRSVR